MQASAISSSLKRKNKYIASKEIDAILSLGILFVIDLHVKESGLAGDLISLGG